MLRFDTLYLNIISKNIPALAELHRLIDNIVFFYTVVKVLEIRLDYLSVYVHTDRAITLCLLIACNESLRLLGRLSTHIDTGDIHAVDDAVRIRLVVHIEDQHVRNDQHYHDQYHQKCR